MIPCYGGNGLPFIGTAEKATKGVPRSTAARHAMDPVHGSRDKTGGRKATAQRTASLSLQKLVGGPPVDVSLACSARLCSITKEQSLVVRFAGADVQRSFNHQIANCGIDFIAPAEARHTVASAEAMCAL